MRLREPESRSALKWSRRQNWEPPAEGTAVLQTVTSHLLEHAGREDVLRIRGGT